MYLTTTQIYRLALDAGFPSDVAVTMTAIAMRESRGNTTAYNGKHPDDSYGLWQINMLGELGRRRRELYGIVDNSELFDPKRNAEIAFRIWDGKQKNLEIAWAIHVEPYKSKYEEWLDEAAMARAVVEREDDNAFLQWFKVKYGVRPTEELASALWDSVLAIASEAWQAGIASWHLRNEDE